MDLGKLGCYTTSEGMTEIRHARSVYSKGDSQMVVSRAGVELGGRVGGASAERHITAILGQKNRISGTTLNFPRPRELPYGEVGVSMETEQNSARTLWISDQKRGESLAVQRVV